MVLYKNRLENNLKTINSRIKVLILFIILFIITVSVIIIKGKTYEYKSKTLFSTDNIDEIIVNIEDENIVKIVDKKIEDEVVKLRIESLNEGKTYITVQNNNTGRGELFSIYVHKFGVISFNEFMGDTSGCRIIPISISIFFLYITYLIIDTYRRSIKKNMYQYENIAYLGMVAFLVFVTISQVLTRFNYNVIVTIINKVSNLFSFTIE